MSKTYSVYILCNKSKKVLYTGITSDLVGRIYDHKTKKYSGFTNKYNLSSLVYYEDYQDVHQAIDREKQIKAGTRAKKISLINDLNPNWDDLYEILT